jgi:hypothetical protein
VIITSTPDWANFCQLSAYFQWAVLWKLQKPKFFGRFLPRKKVTVNFDKKDWGTFWAIFTKKTHLVTLVVGRCFKNFMRAVGHQGDKMFVCEKGPLDSKSCPNCCPNYIFPNLIHVYTLAEYLGRYCKCQK